MKLRFLIFLISTPPSLSLASPLISKVLNRWREIFSLMGGWVIVPAWGWSVVTGFRHDQGTTGMEEPLLVHFLPQGSISEIYVILGKWLCSWLLIISALVWYLILVCIEECSYFFQTSSFSQLCQILDPSSSLLPFQLSKITYQFICACVLSSYIGHYEVVAFSVLFLVYSICTWSCCCFLKSECFIWV